MEKIIRFFKILELYKNVQGPHEARLDARVLKHVSRICRLRSQELSVNQQQFKVHYFTKIYKLRNQ